MRHDVWRRDAASYPLRGELMPRHSDVDIWQHLNNTALISMHGESIQQGLRSVFGPEVWRNSEPALACVGNATDFLAEAYYPEPLTWGARVLGVDVKGVRIGTALFQHGQCVGLHEATVSGWADGQVVGLGPEQLAALRAAGVPGTDTVTPAAVPAGTGHTPDMQHFPWQRTVGIRFGDSDARRLASDTWLGRCAEQVRVELLNQMYGAQRHTGGGMMVAHVALRWLRRTTPGVQWQVGCGVAHTGGRSLAVRSAMFEAERCVALCDSVMVVIDRESRRSMPITDEARALVEPYRLRAGNATGTG